MLRLMGCMGIRASFRLAGRYFWRGGMRRDGIGSLEGGLGLGLRYLNIGRGVLKYLSKLQSWVRGREGVLTMRA